MFINYWFIIFACIFFPVFWLCPIYSIRKVWLLLACMIFHYRFAGPAGVIPIIILGTLTYFAGMLNNKVRSIIIILCVLELLFYKYSTFLLSQLLGFFNPNFSQTVLVAAKQKILPNVPPLAISFFVFEFIHYLVDVQKGKVPIRSPLSFALFSIFWPSVVAGPVKRFEQFLPALSTGCKKISPIDIQIGLMRVIVGLIKKLVIAENLTRYIDFWQPQFTTMNIEHRWFLVVAISLRILFDFSGYSDMAIGFARMMGIKLPENFHWPYLSTSLQGFWQRWHISLSTWIRDYIYIPLGGNQYGKMRRFSNGITAFAICGLWHGAAWNFIFWGLYHGIGLTLFSYGKKFFLENKLILSVKPFLKSNKILAKSHYIVLSSGWLCTFVFVSIGWLFFFYPISDAISMLVLLVK
jgi:alginate O-acetyltransferase complex protein AlgI